MGDYFAELGEKYNKEEPMLLVFNFPVNVYYPDGTRVFPDEEKATDNDMILATRQLKDFNEFMKKWMYE